MKKVLLILSTLGQVGGMEKFVMNLFRYSDPSKVHYDFLISEKQGTDYEKEITSAGSTIYCIPKSKPDKLRFYSSFFREHKYDAVHCNASEPKGYIAPLLFAYLAGVRKLIVHSHSSNYHYDKISLSYKINCLICYRIAGIIISDFCACSDAAGRFMFESRRYHIINNGINLSDYVYSRQIRNKVRKQYRLDNSFVIGMIGRLDKNKGYHIAVDYIASLQKNHPDINARLMIVGAGGKAYTKLVKDRIKMLGLAGSVLFMGERNDVPDLLQAMDCLIMPSAHEGLPFAAVEAQAAGLPVILSDKVPEAVKINDNVVFVPLKAEPEEWAKAIIADTERCADQSRLFEKGYDVSYTIEQMMKVYGIE